MREVNDLLVVIPVRFHDETDVHERVIHVAILFVVGRLMGLVKLFGRVVVSVPPERGTLPDRVRV